MKKLKLYNGRGWGNRIYDENRNFVPDPTGIKFCDHTCVCAFSRSHAVRLINQAVGYNVSSSSELKNYWSECWGDQMKGIEPEIGVWTVQGYNDKPKRIL